MAVDHQLRADARRNRERIIAAARVAFAEHGLDVGVAEIAHRAGVGTATLFRRFPTKQDLVVAVMEECMAHMQELVARAGEAEARSPRSRSSSPRPA